MQKYTFILALLIILGCFAVPVLAKDLSLIEEVLQKVDEQSYFPETDVTAVMSMIIEDPEEGLEKIVVRYFRRDDGERFLLLVRNLKRRRARVICLKGDNLWFYDPSSRKFMHTSLKEASRHRCPECRL